MKVLEKGKATATLAEFADDIKNGPIVITSNGKPIAALIAIENADLETVSLSMNPEFLAIIERSRARRRKEGGISTEEMRRRLASRSPEAQSHQYWIVGAARKGTDDHYQEFISEGYWKLFYRDEEQPAQARKRDQMHEGDRIAIKKMVGGKKGNGKVQIRAIGVIKAMNGKDQRVKVRWEQIDLDRLVAGHSLFRSIHGPFDVDNRVVRDVFGEPHS